MKIKKITHTCQTTCILILLILPSILSSIQLRLDTPNHCYRCDFKGGKKVKKCPVNGFDTSNIEVIECGYQKPICGITVNVTDKPQVIYAGCYTKNYRRHCFNDRVGQYGALNTAICYHTCTDSFFCNPYESWLKNENSGFNLLSVFG